MILNALALRLKRQACGDFKGRHFEATLVVQAVSWYLRYALSYRDIKEMLLEQMLSTEPLFAPDRIGTDGAGPYPPAIADARKEGLLPRAPAHYVTKHLQQGIESDHFRVKRPMPRVGGFRSFNTARRTIQGFEAISVATQGLRVRRRLDRARAEPPARLLLRPSYANKA